VATIRAAQQHGEARGGLRAQLLGVESI